MASPQEISFFGSVEVFLFGYLYFVEAIVLCDLSKMLIDIHNGWPHPLTYPWVDTRVFDINAPMIRLNTKDYASISGVLMKLLRKEDVFTCHFVTKILRDVANPYVW